MREEGVHDIVQTCMSDRSLLSVAARSLAAATLYLVAIPTRLASSPAPPESRPSSSSCNHTIVSLSPNCISHHHHFSKIWHNTLSHSECNADTAMRMA